jgi:hypothetical protein
MLTCTFLSGASLSLLVEMETLAALTVPPPLHACNLHPVDSGIPGNTAAALRQGKLFSQVPSLHCFLLCIIFSFLVSTMAPPKKPLHSID